MSAFVFFTICMAVNVVLSTVKSIVTVKGGKFIAALFNAASYGFYSYIIILTADGDLDALDKILITAACNFIGVYLVKMIEGKTRKARLWKIESTVSAQNAQQAQERLKLNGISFNYFDLTKYTVFNCYCETREQSARVKIIMDDFNAKYFVSETKIL